MVAYTTYIPKEFFLGKAGLLFAIVFIIILVVIIYFGYKTHKIIKIKRRPEEFRR